MAMSCSVFNQINPTLRTFIFQASRASRSYPLSPLVQTTIPGSSLAICSTSGISISIGENLPRKPPPGITAHVNVLSNGVLGSTSYQCTMQVRIQNFHRSFSFMQVNPANLVVGNTTGSGDVVHIQWVDVGAGRARLWVPTKQTFITINAANQVVGAPDAYELQLDLQGNGSYVIRLVNNNIYRLVLSDLSGPVTNEPAPLAGSADYNKQFWMFVPLD
ncbi:hypothetical protein DEU56DRAFT_775462 [Suillus clintonianus]|uniref:uncharacterized protein n=1 Tax=Suillus clintonianus TaxID=1904413 RepID=UPI001B865789|nr:uncharacterized protein DEU56DRAFT_775462 [Suillus clintonianus]KAG2152695.1 hypothetical protein DEU56DRAFT_775462 [Suillus clintonianus]